MSNKVIITCAITGSIHTPSMSSHLPITPEEIANEAVFAAEAGAAIVHLHARDPLDGRPVQDPNLFRHFATNIKQRSDVVLNFTTGGAPTMSIEERLQPALQLKPEVASLNMGSMNFGLFPMLNRFKKFKYDWEEPYLKDSDGRIFKRIYKEEKKGPGDIYTLSLSADGVSICEKSNLGIWPVYAVCNGLPKAYRFCPENVIILGK